MRGHTCGWDRVKTHLLYESRSAAPATLKDSLGVGKENLGEQEDFSFCFGIVEVDRSFELTITTANAGKDSCRPRGRSKIRLVLELEFGTPNWRIFLLYQIEDTSTFQSDRILQMRSVAFLLDMTMSGGWHQQ